MKNLIALPTILLVFTYTTTLYAQPTKTTMGRVESFTLLPEKIILPAKMDTGAFGSSIQATHIHKFTKHDKQWISFTLKHNNINTKLVRPYLGENKIKKRITKSHPSLHYEYRPVVSMHFCLDHHRFHTPVSLANRQYFKYPLLIGRNLMKKLKIIIDPSKKNTHTALC